MFLEERQEKILELLAANGKVLVKELAERFGVTEDSIRKDLGTLELDGKLKRTYGGAVAIREKLHVMEANKRRTIDVEAKRKIAAAAFKMIKPSDMIYLDISTINIALAELIVKSDSAFKVVTNMIDVLTLLSRNPKVDLIFVGGKLNQSRDGFCDGLATEMIGRLKPDIAFIGVVGVDVKDNAVSTYQIEDGICKAKVTSVSKKTYLIAEARKFSTDGNYTFAHVDDFDGVITDTKPKTDVLRSLNERNVEIILP